MPTVTSPFPVFYETDGTPLDAGYIYLGTVDLNPETNPITVYWDAALTIPAAQPLRTSGGYIVRNGITASVFTSSFYSITVKNKNGNLIYSAVAGEDYIPVALLAGSPTQVFSVAPATLASHAARLEQVAGIGFKNKIIGGDFTINPWQRGTSFPAIVANTYFADRWLVAHSTTAVVTASKVADAPTAAQAGIFTQHCMSLEVTTADTSIGVADQFRLRYIVEGLNAASFGFGQAGSRSVTLSFWVKGTKTGTHCVAFRNGVQNRSYVAEYTIATTDTWEYKTIAIPVDTAGAWLYDNSNGLDIDFALMMGTNFHTATANTWLAGSFLATANQVNALDSTANTFKIALVQLEAGSVATSFDVRSVGQELALCQRYYEYAVPVSARGTSSAAGGGFMETHSYFKVTKRAIPTLTPHGAITNVNVTAEAQGSITTQGFRYSIQVGAATTADTYVIDRLYTASAEL